MNSGVNLLNLGRFSKTPEMVGILINLILNDTHICPQNDSSD